MASKKKRSSLADKISSLVTAAPTTFNSDDENDETAAKLVDNEEESDEEAVESDSVISHGGSKFRRQNLDLLNEIDERYEGKKVSRKTLRRNDGLSSATDEDVDDFEGDDKAVGDFEVGDEYDEESETESEDDDEPELEVDEANPLRRREKNEVVGNFEHVSATDVGAEIEKGRCVRGQLGIWESLLEMRIKLQKCLVSGNKMPQYDVHGSFGAKETFSKSTNESKRNLSKLLDNLLELQSALLNNYPDTKRLIRDKSERTNEGSGDDDEDEEIPSDTEDETEGEAEDVDDEGEEVEVEKAEEDRTAKKKRRLEDYESLISRNHSLYTSYRNSVIQKWNDKTRVSVGNVNGKESSQPVVKQIEFILSDKSKLRRRTQLKRSEYNVVGKMDTTTEEGGEKDGRRGQEYDEEIYDDDDFYHQLLRELIEFKSADITDPIQLSKQWIQLQNMRSKMKRKIDTKATKGRRIRFGVHPKLVNFMAPIAVEDRWTDEAKTELYSSLFGKIKDADENPRRD